MGAPNENEDMVDKIVCLTCGRAKDDRQDCSDAFHDKPAEEVGAAL